MKKILLLFIGLTVTSCGILTLAILLNHVLWSAYSSYFIQLLH